MLCDFKGGYETVYDINAISKKNHINKKKEINIKKRTLENDIVEKSLPCEKRNPVS